MHAPPRLAAHLRAVHYVAHRLAAWAEQHYPQLDFNRHAVLFGAATHDIGKVDVAAQDAGFCGLFERLIATMGTMGLAVLAAGIVRRV